MVQSSRRLIQLVLLCLIWELGPFGAGWLEYSGIRIQQEDQGKILLFLINVVVDKVGKKLDKGYRCPVYCGVKHNHIYYEIKKSNIQAADGLHRAAGDTTKEQSAVSIRPITGIN